MYDVPRCKTHPLTWWLYAADVLERAMRLSSFLLEISARTTDLDRFSLEVLLASHVS